MISSCGFRRNTSAVTSKHTCKCDFSRVTASDDAMGDWTLRLGRRHQVALPNPSRSPNSTSIMILHLYTSSITTQAKGRN